MFHFPKLISVLCLALLAWTLVAASLELDLFFVLPVVAVLYFSFTSQSARRLVDSDCRIADSFLSSIPLRAPPQL